MDRDRVLILGLQALLLVLLGVGLFRLASPATGPANLPALPPETASSGSDAPGPRRPNALPEVGSLHLARSTPATNNRSPAPSDTPPAARPSTSAEKFPLSRLPFRLIGTVIGPSGYRAAVLEHTDSGAIRSLSPGRAWEDLQVRRVEEERIHVRNTRRNRVEVLRLARTDTSPPEGAAVRNVQGPDRDRDDRDRPTRERSDRGSRDDDDGDRPTFREKKKRKNREAMKKLQDILKERRDR